MSDEAERIRTALIRSCQVEPLLIPAEEALHSHGDTEERAQLQGALSRSLDSGPALSEADRFGYGSLDREAIERFRRALRNAVRGGANLADAEEQILESLGMQKVAEFRTSLQSQLGGPAEVPDRDLAIYVAADESRGEQLKRAIEDRLTASLQEVAEGDELAPGEPEVAPPGAPTLATAPAASGRSATSVTLPERQRAPALHQRAPEGLTPVPMLTAALEAIGLDRDSFGFLLRYGSYAPEGRKSQFLIGGLGLTDLSRRLSAWLDAQGPLDGQVQVLDEGSGELTIYLLGQESAG